MWLIAKSPTFSIHVKLFLPWAPVLLSSPPSALCPPPSCSAPPAAQAMRRNWNPLTYFTDAWHMVDFASTALLVATAAMWFHILRTAARFRISLRCGRDIGVVCV